MEVQKIKIHHLTDVHIGPLHYSYENKLNIVPVEHFVNLPKYREFLSEMPLDDLPDIVVISGDLTSYASDDEFDLAVKWISDLVEIMKKKKSSWREAERNSPYIFIVPGNHDLDWSEDSYATKIKRYCRSSDILCNENNVLSACYGAHKNNPVYYDFSSLNIFFYLFNSTPLGGTDEPVIKEVIEEINDKIINAYHDTLNAKNEEIIKAVNRLNKYVKQDPGYVSKDSLKEMENVLRSIPKERIKIGVMHHNLTSVPSDDVEIFDTIVNAGIVKDYLIRNEFDIVLNGHRHFWHAVREIHLAHPKNKQGLLIVSGDTFGCRSEAPYNEISISSPIEAHRRGKPSALLTIKKVNYVTNHYTAENVPSVQEAVDKSLYDEIFTIMKSFCSEYDHGSASRDELISKCKDHIERTHGIWSDRLDWSDKTQWIRDFHIQLYNYGYIFATDIFKRSSLRNARYYLYLLEQINERLKRIVAGENNDKTLYYTSNVYDAIIRTGWRPNGHIWKDYNISKGELNKCDLQIVRILVRPTDLPSYEKSMLKVLDFIHQICGIPLFVLNIETIDKKVIKDYACGYDHDGEPLKCYEYDEANSTVEEVDISPQGRRRDQMKDVGDVVLSNKKLKTVEQFLQGDHYPVLMGEARDIKDIALSYDNTRFASKRIIDIILKHIKSKPNNIGIDVGCGTGNYTMPFAEHFSDLYGVDICKEMIDQARSKNKEINWVVHDAMLLDEKRGWKNRFDALWSVSTLHYLLGLNQKYFMEQAYYILKPGGVAVIETTFREQLNPFWFFRYFPSMHKRYYYACLKKDQYKVWANEIGFSDCEFDVMITKKEEESVLQLACQNPKILLDDNITDNLPVFKFLDWEEIKSGQASLEKDILKGKGIDDEIVSSEECMKKEGSNGFIILKK